MATSQPYEKWLEEKLVSVNPEVDTEVFVMYINGILDTDTSVDEKRESILDILGEVVDGNGEKLCDEIVNKWQEENNQDNGQNNNAETLATQLSQMLEKQTIESVKPKEKTSQSSANKQAILAQYANVSDEEVDGHPADPGGAKGSGSSGAVGVNSDPLLAKNTNVEDVQKIEKEKREKAKQDSDKKREKDKEDRAAQKQKQQERKDTEKKRTQKGERKR